MKYEFPKTKDGRIKAPMPEAWLQLRRLYPWWGATRCLLLYPVAFVIAGMVNHMNEQGLITTMWHINWIVVVASGVWFFYLLWRIISNLGGGYWNLRRHWGYYKEFYKNVAPGINFDAYWRTWRQGLDTRSQFDSEAYVAAAVDYYHAWRAAYAADRNRRVEAVKKQQAREADRVAVQAIAQAQPDRKPKRGRKWSPQEFVREFAKVQAMRGLDGNIEVCRQELKRRSVEMSSELETEYFRAYRAGLELVRSGQKVTAIPPELRGVRLQ